MGAAAHRGHQPLAQCLAAGAGGSRRRRPTRSGRPPRRTADGRRVAISDGGEATPIFAAEGPRVAGWSLAMLDPARGPSSWRCPRTGSGAPLLWKPGAGRFPFVSLTLSGRDRQSTQRRSNASGIGAQLAARAGSQWTALAHVSRAIVRRPESAADRVRPGRIAAARFRRHHVVRRRASRPSWRWRLDRFGRSTRPSASCRVVRSSSHSTAGTSPSSPTCSASAASGPRRARASTSRRVPRENVLLPEGLLAGRDGRVPVEDHRTDGRGRLHRRGAARRLRPPLRAGRWCSTNAKPSPRRKPTGEPRFFRDERLPVQVTATGGEDVTRAVTRGRSCGGAAGARRSALHRPHRATRPDAPIRPRAR